MRLLGGIGLGTFPFSKVFGEISDKEAEKIVYTYLDLGGKYIQTAPYYIGVDDFIGKILKSITREKYYISTLCAKNRDGVRTGKYKAIIEQCEDSLRHLGVEYIDLLMTSTPKANDVPYRETIEAMVDLQTQGKIREIGVANVNLAQLKEYNNSGKIRYVQNRFSLLDQSISNEFNIYCSQNNIGFIPYNVIEWGILTNKILTEINLRNDDLRKNLPEFRAEALSLIKVWVTQYLKPIAESIGTSIEGLSILWAINQPNISLCVLGATRVCQLESNLLTHKLQYDPLVIGKINKAYKEFENIVSTRYGYSVSEFLGNAYK